MTDETTPSREQNDDVEGHALRIKGPEQPAETEAHGRLSIKQHDDAEAPQAGTEYQSVQDDGPDVEGHGSVRGS